MVELVSSTDIHGLELPQTRAQSCYMVWVVLFLLLGVLPCITIYKEPTLGIERQTEGNSLDAPSSHTPMPDIANHGSDTMDITNAMSPVQSSDHDEVSSIYTKSISHRNTSNLCCLATE